MTQNITRPVYSKKRVANGGVVRPTFNGPAAIKTADLQKLIDGWLLDGEYRRLSQNTTRNRIGVMRRLQWWIACHKIDTLDHIAMRSYFAYAANSSGGRWGNETPGKIRNVEARPIRASTLHTYYIYLQSFFNWCVAESLLAVSPLDRVTKPNTRSASSIEPFSVKQLESLLLAAKESAYPERDTAMAMFLLDTGVRVSELISIKIGEVDKTNKTVKVLGKGRKYRLVRFGKETSMALWRYLRGRHDGADDDAPVFVSHAGNLSGSALTRDGVQALVTRLGRDAGITGVRCSPHTFRHTFAVQFLRNGGNSFALQALLGHTDLKMTQKYVALAQTDLADQHVMASPMDNLRRRK